MDFDKEKYLKLLQERKKETHVYQEHQMVGLMLAELLEDEKHKGLYIKLAKTHNAQKLISLAKSISTNRNIERKGAYFMKLFYSKDE